MKIFFLLLIIFQIIKLGSSEDKYFIKINDHEYLFELENTEFANQIKSKLPFTVKMKNLNGNEVYHEFNENFKKDEKSINTINTGDIYLYQSNCLVLFYKSFSTSYKYTEIGKLKEPIQLENVIGSGDVVVYWCLNTCTEYNSSKFHLILNIYLIIIISIILL